MHFAHTISVSTSWPLGTSTEHSVVAAQKQSLPHGECHPTLVWVLSPLRSSLPPFMRPKPTKSWGLHRETAAQAPKEGPPLRHLETRTSRVFSALWGWRADLGGARAPDAACLSSHTPSNIRQPRLPWKAGRGHRLPSFGAASCQLCGEMGQGILGGRGPGCEQPCTNPPWHCGARAPE